MYPASSEGLNKETGQAVYFFSPAFDPFNNFSAHRIKIWGKQFHTAEQAFQWQKFSVVRPDLAEQIMEADSPEAAKQISDANKANMPKDWHERKVEIMEQILRAKAEQHQDVREALQRSGNREIVENSPVDSFWGCGPDGQGQNMLGKIWMKIRTDFNDKL